jgi:hypothetical protein
LLLTHGLLHQTVAIINTPAVHDALSGALGVKLQRLFLLNETLTAVVVQLQLSCCMLTFLGPIGSVACLVT